jgi:hypothetical protein
MVGRVRVTGLAAYPYGAGGVSQLVNSGPMAA